MGGTPIVELFSFEQLFMKIGASGEILYLSHIFFLLFILTMNFQTIFF